MDFVRGYSGPPESASLVESSMNCRAIAMTWKLCWMLKFATADMIRLVDTMAEAQILYAEGAAAQILWLRRTLHAAR